MNFLFSVRLDISLLNTICLLYNNEKIFQSRKIFRKLSEVTSKITMTIPITVRKYPRISDEIISSLFTVNIKSVFNLGVLRNDFFPVAEILSLNGVYIMTTPHRWEDFVGFYRSRQKAQCKGIVIGITITSTSSKKYHALHIQLFKTICTIGLKASLQGSF